MGAERRAQQRELDYNSAEAQKQRDWESSEAQLSRDWQSQQVLQQNQFAVDQARQQQQYNLQSMKQQAEYNSPVYQRQQLEQAGINPAVYFGQKAGFSGSSAIAAAPGAVPSPGTSSPPSGAAAHSGSQVVSNIPQMIASAADMVKALGGYQVDSAQSLEIKSLLEGRVKNLVLDNEQKQLFNDHQEVVNDILNSIKDVKVKEAFMQLENTAADTYLKLASGDQNVSMTALHYSQMQLNNVLSDLHGQEAALIKLKIGSYQDELNHLFKVQETEAKKNTAQATEAYASAGEHQAATRERNANAFVLENEGRIRKVAADIRESGSSKELLSYLSDLDAKGAISQSQYKEAVISAKKLQSIIETYGNDAGRREFDAELENFFSIIGLRTSIHN